MEDGGVGGDEKGDIISESEDGGWY